MSQDSTTGGALSPLDSARASIKNARQLAGGSEEDLTMAEREQIVTDLSGALRDIDRHERENTCVPKPGEGGVF